MMTRTQLLIDSELHRRARARANQLGVSLAEYVRRLLAADLLQDRAAPSVTDIFDLGNSGGSDIASHKDAYLGQAVEETVLRR